MEDKAGLRIAVLKQRHVFSPASASVFGCGDIYTAGVCIIGLSSKEQSGTKYKQKAIYAHVCLNCLLVRPRVEARHFGLEDIEVVS